MRSDVPHSKPEALKPQASKPIPLPASQKTSEAQQLPVGNQVLQKRFEQCRKEGGHIFNGLCVSSIPEAQGYGQRVEECLKEGGYIFNGQCLYDCDRGPSTRPPSARCAR